MPFGARWRKPFRLLATRAYAGFWLVLRLLWLALALANATVVHLDRVVYAMEVVLLIGLVGETHTRFTSGIDPGPPDEDSLLARDVGAQILFILTFLGYLAVLVRILHVPVPPPFAAILETTLPTGLLSLFLLAIGIMLWSGVFIGGYAHLRDPGLNGCLHRVVGRLIGFTAADVRSEWIDELEGALDGDYTWPVTSVVIGLVALQVGTIVSLLAFMMASLALPILRYPLFFLIVVVAWLGYDFYTARLADHESIRGLVAHVSHEIDRPQSWLFDLEVLEAGFKGVTTTLFLVMGGVLILFLLAGAGADALRTGGSLVFEMGGVLAGQLSQFGPGALLNRPSLFLSTFGVLSLGLVLSTFAVGIYGFALWYQLLQRLPTWIGRYWEDDRTLVETRPLPSFATVIFSVLALSYYGLVWLLEYRRVTLASPDSPVYLPTLVAIGGLFLLHARLGLGVLQRFRETIDRGTTRLDLPALRQDNHRILIFGLVVFGGFLSILGRFHWLVPTGLLLGITMAYYLPEVYRIAGRHIDNRVAYSLATQAYVVTIGLVVYVPLVMARPSLSPLRWMFPVVVVILLASTLVDYLLFWR